MEKQSWFCRISEFGSIKKREFVTPIVAERQDVMRITTSFQRWEFLRPFGSKRTEFERQIPDFIFCQITNSAERGNNL